MPKVTPGASYHKEYCEEDLNKAIAAVQNGMAKKTAATKFGVPRATLQFRLSSQFVKAKPGPGTVLGDDGEKGLVDWIVTCSKKGFPKRKEDIQLSVEQFLAKNPRDNCFINNKPGEGWYRLFMKRHPEITTRTAEAVTSASANVSEENIRHWFTQIEQYLQDNDLMHIVQDPTRVYNGDETNFQLCPKNTKVLAEKGAKNVYEVDHAQAKSCLTVMFTFSASGETTPPMVIYPLKRMRPEIRASVPSSWGLGLSDNGWMTQDLFFQYISNVLYPHLVKQKVIFPIILFLDGHKSHMNYDLSEYCQSKGIILIALYPNATRILQPADVAAFKPLKSSWKKAVLDWRRNNLVKTLTKVDFGPILECALKTHINKTTIINGFKACGLCPWNPDAIDYSKCLGKSSGSAQNRSTCSNFSQPNRTLNLENFEKIVGQSILDELLQNSLADDENPSRNALRKIFNFLKPDTSNVDINLNEEELQKTGTDSLLIGEDWVPLDDIPIIISEDPNTDMHVANILDRNDHNITLDETTSETGTSPNAEPKNTTPEPDVDISAIKKTEIQPPEPLTSKTGTLTRNAKPENRTPMYAVDSLLTSKTSTSLNGEPENNTNSESDVDISVTSMTGTSTRYAEPENKTPGPIIDKTLTSNTITDDITLTSKTGTHQDTEPEDQTLNLVVDTSSATMLTSKTGTHQDTEPEDQTLNLVVDTSSATMLTSKTGTHQDTEPEDQTLNLVVDTSSATMLTSKTGTHQDTEPEDQTPNLVVDTSSTTILTDTFQNAEPSNQTPEKTTLRNSLIWPKTPVRKGRHMNDKPIYVLTSAEWLEKEKKKLEEKERKENVKQERKRQREQKKTEKINKSESKSKKKKTAQKNEKKSKLSDSEDDLPLTVFKTPPKSAQDGISEPLKDTRVLIKDKCDLKKANITLKMNKVKKENKPKENDVIPKEATKDTSIQKNLISKPVITSQKTLQIITQKTKPTQMDQKNKKIEYQHTVKSPKEFVLSKDMNKVLKRKAAFRNENELATYLNNLSEDD